MALFNPNPPVLYAYPENFGALGDVVEYTGASISAGSNILTVTNIGFRASDIGKRIVIQNAGATVADGFHQNLVTTIAGYTSSSIVTLADTATNAVPNAMIPTSGAVAYGTDDSAALIAANVWAKANKTAVYLRGKKYGVASTLTAMGSILGTGMDSAFLVGLADNFHMLESAGQYYVWDGFHTRFAAQQTELDTDGICFYRTASASFREFRNLRFTNGYRGWDGDSVTTLFSSNVDNVRFRDSADDNRVSVSNETSGLCISNVYASAPSRDRTNILLTIGGQVQGTVNLINMEQANVLGSPLYLPAAQAIDISAMNIESVRAFDPTTWTGLIRSASTSPTTNGIVHPYWYVGGYRITSLTRDGTTASAVLEGLDSLGGAFTNGGCGIRIGETVYISFNAEFLGSYTVTGYVHATKTLSFTCAGTETTPAVLATGNDFGVASRNGAASDTYAAFQFESGAEGLDVQTFYPRGTAIFGPTSARRASLVRLVKNKSPANGRLRIRRLARRGRYRGRWDQDNAIVAVSRTSNVETYWFKYEHNLEVGSIFRNSAGSFPASFGGPRTVLTILDKHSVTVTGSGVDVPFQAVSGCSAVYSPFASVSRSRTSNIATIITATNHNLLAGATLRTYNAASSGYTDSETQVLTVPDATTYTYYNQGVDEGTTADVLHFTQPIDNPYVVSTSYQVSGAQAVDDFGHLFRVLACIPAETIAALTQGTATVTTVKGAKAGDRLEIGVTPQVPAGLRLIAEVTADDTITLTPESMLASGSISLTDTLVRIRLVRD